LRAQQRGMALAGFGDKRSSGVIRKTPAKINGGSIKAASALRIAK